MPRPRRLAAGATTADLFVQLAARCVPALHGPRLAAGDRPGPARSDGSVSIADGALVPWSVGNSSFYESVINAICERYEIDPDTPWDELSEDAQNLFLYGTQGERVYVQYRNRMGRKRSYMLAFEGIVPSLQRRYKDTDSSHQRERIEEYMSFRPCPVCKGARLKPEVLAVTIGERSINELTQLSVTRPLEFLDGLDLTDTEQLIGHRVIKEIRERLTFLDNVGVGYLQLDRASATLSGGEAQRLRLATQIGSQLVSVLYILDQPSIGLHQRDNGRLIETLMRLRDLGNSVLVVEHDEQMMRSADWLVDMGRWRASTAVTSSPKGWRRRSSAQKARSPDSSSLGSARSRCRSGAAGTAASSRCSGRRSTT